MHHDHTHQCSLGRIHQDADASIGMELEADEQGYLLEASFDDEAVRTIAAAESIELTLYIIVFSPSLLSKPL